MARRALVLLTAALNLSACLASHNYTRRDDTPQLPYDPDTTPYCTWWIDNDGSSSCTEILSAWVISLEDLGAGRSKNPSITASCGGLETGMSYCVEAWGEPAPTSDTSTTAEPTSTATTATTTTGNAPGPTQSGQIKTCNRWDLYSGLSLANLVEWNPAIGTQCQNLWVDTYACSSLRWTAPPTTTTTTAPGNGITTPTPIQPGMVSDCASFHAVQSGDTSASIAQSAGCTSIWLRYFVCISRVGVTATITTTTATTAPGNGISTPTPTLPGMATSCDAFYLVQPDDGCAGITTANGISVSQLYAWNSNLGSGCSGLWGSTTSVTTTTTTGNGVATPMPIQPGMTGSCSRFYQVLAGDQCGTIAGNAGITLANFLRWNPGVGGNSCSLLWLGYWVCVAVL
ncbi:hypothetical protein BDV12DRAFT_207026 [Aspergillus spectabilis]